jgi:hypothetical protein
MVTNLQFAAVAAYLLWCLFSALTGVFDTDDTEAGVQINGSDKNGEFTTAG